VSLPEAPLPDLASAHALHAVPGVEPQDKAELDVLLGGRTQDRSESIEFLRQIGCYLRAHPSQPHLMVNLRLEKYPRVLATPVHLSLLTRKV
jgi:hypothetical protein